MQTTEQYFDSTHRLGRMVVIATFVFMLAIPVIIGVALGAMPSAAAILAASIGLLAIYVPVTISEVLAYTPVIGSSIYLSLVTGNILNLKLPAAINAMKLTNVEQGSEKGDVISSIAIAVSSITTVSILVIGVLLMVPLKPVLLLPAVKTASSYILPALFGAMTIGLSGNSLGGGIIARKRMLGAVAPALGITAIWLWARPLMQLQGVLILLMLPATYFGTKLLYKKGVIRVTLPDDPAAPAGR